MMLEQVLFVIFIGTNAVSTLPVPSYTSEWKTIKSQNALLSEITFNHNLSSWPIKVHAELKVQSHDLDLFFPGMGTAQIDDDRSFIYGQTLTYYDDVKVKVIAPNRFNGASTGVVIYAGTSGWFGPDNITRIYGEASVRVKAWKREDFPDPDFETSWQDISTQEAVTYKEIMHNISGYPSFAVVQVKSVGYIYEGQGSSSIINPLSNHGGGLIYGFSKQHFRIWYPYQKLVFSEYDGWGDNSGAYSRVGQFRIIAWKFQEKCLDTVVTSKNELTQNNFVLPLANAQHYYINTEVEALGGNNDGFRFYGVGSTVNDGDLGPFGGLIYSYSTENIMFWWPNNASDGTVINIGGNWGNGLNPQSSDEVAIRINTFSCSDKPSYLDTKVKYTNYEEYGIHNGVLPVNNTLLFTATSYVQCAASCSSEDACESFFFHKDDKTCVGYEYSIFNSAHTHSSSPGMQHFIKIV